MKKTSTLLLCIFFSVCAFSQQLAWLQLPAFPGGVRYQPTSFAINGKGYVGMGLDSNYQYHNDLYEYDPVGNTWAQKAPFPSTARDHCSSFVVDSFVYVIAGEKSGGAMSEVWQYNPSNDSWAQKTDLIGTARESGTGFVIGNKIYFGTGYVGGSNLDDFYEYNTTTNSWTPKANVPGGIRNAAIGFSVDGKGYVGLGAYTNGGNFHNDLYEYDPIGDTWSTKANYPMPNGGASAYQSATSGYVLCGSFEQHNGGITYNPLNLLYRYTPANDNWNLEGSFPGLPRCYAGEFSIDKDIYLCAGTQTLGAVSIVAGHTPMLSDFWKLASIIDSVPLGMEHINDGAFKSGGIKIFPNPSHDYLNIGIQALNTLSHIRIYDVSGKMITEFAATNSPEQLDISQLAAGTYYAELVGKNKEIYTGRFIKQ